LAGGIAHDFNNLLMGLFGNLSLIKRRLESEHPAFKFVDRAEQSLHRATHLTRKLLTFAKGGAPVREQVSLGELVEEIVSFDLSGSNVRPVFVQTDDLWAADVDKGQIQQVFSNLAINADQAMPDGGHLYIELQNFDNSFGDCTDLAAGKYIKAQVRDEGTGIDPKVQKFIFDPYFSTKQTGRGLGLASVYSIITRHKGVINVNSETGRGTTFTFYLPAADGSAREKQRVSDTSAGAINLSAKVLVMDDDDSVLDIVAEMLETMGCTVVTAKNGQEAVELFRQARLAGRPFDVVSLDLTVPGGGGGKETIKQLLQLDPQAKVIVSSGYADDPVMARYADYGFTAVITKPYIFDQLHKVIGGVLKTGD
ncbi:MAG: response regulator, partial [Deltaproteobacteria bacterium]|nr:response regulator [Deltaproteobacteria bacterium]